MKKITAVLILLLTFALSVKSQVLIALVFGDKLNSPKTEFGLNVGANLSTISNVSNAKYNSDFGIGMYFTWKFHDRWQLQPEFFFRFPTGSTKLPPYELEDTLLTRLTSNSTITRSSRSASFPIHIRYRVWKQFRITFAPQVSYIYSNIDSFRKELEGGDEILLNRENKSHLNRFDFGLSAGVSFKLKQGKGVNLEARYYMGFSDTSSDDLPGMNANRAICLYVGIPIGSEKDVKTSLDAE